jgi:serine/threonine protein phosphatase PrpC
MAGALQQAFKDADREIVRKSEEEDDWNDGSTAAIAVIEGNKLWIANVGDTEVCLVGVDT